MTEMPTETIPASQEEIPTHGVKSEIRVLEAQIGMLSECPLLKEGWDEMIEEFVRGTAKRIHDLKKGLTL